MSYVYWKRRDMQECYYLLRNLYENRMLEVEDMEDDEKEYFAKIVMMCEDIITDFGRKEV